jgi:predicted negative regulator of RcsB-dependent stress response
MNEFYRLVKKVWKEFFVALTFLGSIAMCFLLGFQAGYQQHSIDKLDKFEKIQIQTITEKIKIEKELTAVEEDLKSCYERNESYNKILKGLIK